MPSDNDVFNSLVDNPVDDPAVRDALGRLFARVTVAVPSRTDPSSAEGLTPLAMEIEGVPHIPVATSSAALDKAGQIAPFAAEMTGAGLLSMLDEGVGVVADTGSASCAFSPERVASLRAPTRTDHRGTRAATAQMRKGL